MESFIRAIRGLTFFLMLTIGAVFSCVTIFPTLLFISIPSLRVIKLRRKIVSVVSGIYFSFASAVLLKFCGTRLFIHCNTTDFLNDKDILIISNHRTRIDWMYVAWCYGTIIGNISELRIILQEALRSIPIYGWSMQLMLYIFLARRKDYDVPHISKMLTYLMRTGPIPSILLFPEGTDLSPSNIIKSNTYAREKSKKEFSYVLYPKPSGFLCCVNSMRGNNIICHDITIAYRDYEYGRRASEYSMISGILYNVFYNLFISFLNK